MKKLLQLFLAFARVGVMTFGGGYAMIPILEREIVDRHNWASGEELMDYYAVGQCTPGIIAVNTATFADIPAVKSAFAAIRVCVCVLIFNAVLKLWKGAVKDKAALALFLLVFILSIFLDISPVFYVLFCALAGILLTRWGVRGK